MEQLLDSRYVVADIDVSALSRATTGVVASIDSLPFKEGSFDTVVCVSMLQYVVNVRNALLELRRVAVAGGQVIVEVPNFAYARRRVATVRGGFPRMSVEDSWENGSVRFFTAREFRALLETVGFEVERQTCSGRWWAVKSLRPSLLGGDLIFDLRRQI